MTSLTRRQILTTLSLAGAAGLARMPQATAEEGSLETTTVRILKNPGICIAPQLIADDLLRADGFSEVRYVDQGQSLDLSAKIGRGDADFSLDFAARTVQTIDSGGPVTVLAGVHVRYYNCSRGTKSAGSVISREEPSACRSADWNHRPS